MLLFLLITCFSSCQPHDTETSNESSKVTPLKGTAQKSSYYGDQVDSKNNEIAQKDSQPKKPTHTTFQHVDWNGAWSLDQILCHNGTNFKYEPHHKQDFSLLKINDNTGEMVVRSEPFYYEIPNELTSSHSTHQDVSKTTTVRFRIEKDPYQTNFIKDGDEIQVFQNSLSQSITHSVPQAPTAHRSLIDTEISSNHDELNFKIKASRFMFIGPPRLNDIEMISFGFQSARNPDNASNFDHRLEKFIQDCFSSSTVANKIQQGLTFLTIRWKKHP